MLCYRTGLLSAIAVVLALSACSASDVGGANPANSAADPAGGASEEGADIVISDFAFSPEVVPVAADETITVVNVDGVAHTLTADDGSFDTGQLEPGEKAEVRVQPGVRFHCGIHPNMRAATTEAPDG